jgi:hypothetical protein
VRIRSAAPGVRWLKIRSSDNRVAATVAPSTVADSDAFTVIASQRRDAPLGMHFGTIVINTTNQLKPQLRIPVRGTVVER